MTGPKSGIEMYPPILIEYDLRIKNGGLEEDDMELIDGAMPCFLRTPSKPVKHLIDGNCGTVGISLAFVEYAVEATIEVVISDAQRGFCLWVPLLILIGRMKKSSFFKALIPAVSTAFCGGCPHENRDDFEVGGVGFHSSLIH
jgi:hypothetical protein